MNMLADGAEYLRSTLKRCASEKISYSPSGGASFEIDAVIGGTLFRVDDEYGVTVRTRSTDFIVAASDLAIVPKKGDEIVYRGERYEVLAPNNEPCWRYSDAAKASMRIHAKKVGAA